MTDLPHYNDMIELRQYRLGMDEPERFPDPEDPSEANDDEFDDDDDADDEEEDELNEDLDEE